MDLAIYINELLGLKGEVNVPGIGFFSQKRINGYFNEKENKFYPPRHEIVFDPSSKEDEGLAEYISQKKKISPASAKYFIEKYTAGLKKEALVQSTAIAGLGHLFYEYSTLTFKAESHAAHSDPTFFGFAPVSAHRVASVSSIVNENQAAKKVNEPENKRADDGSVSINPEVEPVVEKEPEYQEEEFEEKPGNNTWIYILLIIIIALLCFGVAYQYKPEWFGKRRAVDTTIIVNGPPPAAKIPDTVKTVKKDTPVKQAAIDTFAQTRYEIQAGAFKTLNKVNAVISEYQKLGLQPRLLQHSTGTLNKITLGTYFKKEDAIRVEDSIKKIPGINSGDISIIPYYPIKVK